ncbi:odorant receptor Or2-like isoform X1 [Bombus affinis]|uniref:odorant receptor Or2-like isoform X1 n=1 Tax=Bombus affinis TaxID=309941 RepID=UPI0021B76D6E|nr:odorant receptor Or2-like isoform X1 [Bombus affinis]
MHLSVRHQTDPPQNTNYEEDIVYVTKHNKWVLNSIGMWPAVLKGIGKFVPKVVIGLSNIVSFLNVVQCVLYITLEENDPLLRLRLLGLACFASINLMKYWALIARKPNIEYCIEQVHTDWKQVEIQRNRILMLKYGKMGRDLTIYSAVFMYSAEICYVTVMQYAMGLNMKENNRTIRLLVYPTYSGFFDAQKSPVYEIVYVLQCMCTFLFNSVTVGCCGLAALFATHACGQIDIVISQLDDLVEGKFSEKNSNPNTRLMEIVKHHIRILKFSAMIETVLQEVCFFEFVGSTFVICLLEYYCITDWQQNDRIGLATYSMLLVSLTFNMFLLCYIGNLLIDKSTSVGISCYMIDWYRLPIKTIQDLILIITMSNSPAKISAARIFILSLPTFGNVLKTSFAYLNFIRNTIIY